MTVPASVGTPSTDFAAISTNWNTRAINHTVAATTSLLIVSVAVQADDADVTAAAWDVAGVNESMTLIDATASSGLASDVKVFTFGLVSPTDKTADLTLTGTTINTSSAIITNYKNTDTASVAAATNFVEEVVNDANSLTAVYASGGSAGNKLYCFHSWNNDTADPITANGTWATVAEEKAATATAENNSIVVDEDAASALTLTSSVSDENAGHLIELVAAAGLSIPIAAHHYRTLRG